MVEKGVQGNDEEIWQRSGPRIEGKRRGGGHTTYVVDKWIRISAVR